MLSSLLFLVSDFFPFVLDLDFTYQRPVKPYFTTTSLMGTGDNSNNTGI